MNPVDHVRVPSTMTYTHLILTVLASLTEVVIINILVKPQLSHAMPRKVKRQVLLQQGGRVYCGERRKRTRYLGGSSQGSLEGYVAPSNSWLQLRPTEYDAN